jgi:hypothetical protein
MTKLNHHRQQSKIIEQWKTELIKWVKMLKSWGNENKMLSKWETKKRKKWTNIIYQGIKEERKGEVIILKLMTEGIMDRKMEDSFQSKLKYWNNSETEILKERKTWYKTGRRKLGGIKTYGMKYWRLKKGE